MSVAVTDHPAEHRYVATVDGRPAGQLVYRDRDGIVALVHTEVDPAFEGQGVGGALARFALDAARESGRAVLPFCPFVNAYLERHPEDVPLVPAAYRADFGLADGGIS